MTGVQCERDEDSGARGGADSMPFSSWQKFRTRRDSLRIPASRIAALAGYHPFQILPEVICNLVYQGPGGRALLHQDASTLDLTLVSDEEALKSLASKAGPKVVETLETAMLALHKDATTAQSQKVLGSIKTAQDIKEKVVQQAKKSRKLNSKELALLQEKTRSLVDTGFGNHHEEDALDLLERKGGFEIKNRNAEVLEWPFQLVEEKANCSGDSFSASLQGLPMVKPLRPAQPSTAHERGRRKRQRGRKAKKGSKASMTKEEGTKVLLDVPTIPADQLNDSVRKIERVAEEPDHSNSLRQHSSCSYGIDSNSVHPLISGEIDEGQLPRDHESTINSFHPLNSRQTEEARSPTNREGAIIDLTSDGDNSISHTKHTNPRQDTNLAACDENHSDGSAGSSEEVLDNERKHERGNPAVAPPFFIVVGSVDGIREEFVPCTKKKRQTDNKRVQSQSSDVLDEDSWLFHPVVVEVKHRLRRIHKEPPLYEVIQCCVYCLMYNVEDADLVQILRPHKTTARPKTKQGSLVASNTPENPKELVQTRLDGSPAKASTSLPIKEEPIIVTHRISLTDPTFNHKHHWTHDVLPRLASLVQSIYSIRSDDGKRLRLLNAVAHGDTTGDYEQGWALAFEECPWLRECDTAYRPSTQK